MAAQADAPSPVRLTIIAGTRPEAIKIAPVALLARSRPQEFSCRIISTGQHRELFQSALAAFGLSADEDLYIMTERQTLAQVAARSIERLDAVLGREPVDMALVQGDTLAVTAGALAAFFHKIPIGHIEAGLRTGHRYDPFPEEMNRLLASRLCNAHFAPTEGARAHLLAEGISAESIYVTGNTATDAIQWVAQHQQMPVSALIRVGRSAQVAIDSTKRLILVTAHRRENIPDRLTSICRGLARLAARPDVQVVFAVHPNPAVREIVVEELGDLENVALVEPPDYAVFAGLMARCHLILTDSGGLQEEAPSLRKPVLIARETTERPEGVHEGVAKLVGTDAARIVEEATLLLDSPKAYAAMASARNPYGDGHCADRILQAALHFLGRGERPDDYRVH